MTGESPQFHTDPLRDEAYIADVAAVITDGLLDENIRSLAEAGGFTKEQVAALAAAIVAQEDGKLTEYGSKVGEVGKKVIRMIDRDNG